MMRTNIYGENVISFGILYCPVLLNEGIGEKKSCNEPEMLTNKNISWNSSVLFLFLFIQSIY